MVLLQESEILEDLGGFGECENGRLVNESELHARIRWETKLLNIIHLNIRSVHKNFDSLILLLESFRLSHCDIIVLSECFRISSTDQCNIPGYDTFYNQADYNKNDGVIILVKSDINAQFSYNRLPNSHATVGRISFKIHNISFGITAVYKPPPVSKQEFIADLHSFFETTLLQNIEIFIGDININVLNPENNDVCDYLSTLARLGFRPYIESITRPETGTCLDHIFVNRKLKVKNMSCCSYILDTDITDHYPIMLNINMSDFTSHDGGTQDTIVRTKLHLNKFKKLLKAQDWSNITNNRCPEIATKNFISTYKNLMNQATESYNLVTRVQKKIKPWITGGLITSIKHRDKMKKRLLNNDSTELKNEYKLYRNYLNKLINKQKNDYYKTEIDNNKHNVKKIYEIIKNACCEKSKKKSSLKINDDNGHEIHSNREAADYCNDYFINIGAKMAEQIPCSQKPSRLDNSVSASMYLTPLSKNDIIRHIYSLKNNSSPGYDGISAELIKQTHLEVVLPLLHIINLIFQTGIVPSDFKTTIVTPIHKTGSVTDIKNYRPISVISNFAKIFEKSLKEKLVRFFNDNNVISTNQYGFMEGYGTSDALLKLTSEVTNNLNNGKKCIGVFIDLAKAFDTVPHDKLLGVLSSYGVRGAVLKLIGSYLTERLQMVKVNGSLSNSQVIKIGVPQGTVLGPLLFITYINSLLKLETGGLTISYADDTALIFNGDDWEQTKTRVTRGLLIVKNWMETYKLSLNLSKTNYIAFSLTMASRPNFSEITICGNEIREVLHTKYLGIVVDQFLKWHFHIGYLSNRIHTLIHKFYLLREFLNRNLLITVYRAVVESLIRYGILAWGGLYKNALHRLNIVQKYILKIIFKKNRLYPSRLLFTAETCNIRTIYVIAVCSYFHSHDIVRKYVDHMYNTRTKVNRHLQIPINHRTINLKYIDYIAPKVYNLLPGDIKKVKNKRRFCKECTRYIVANYDRFMNVFV